MHSGMTGNAMSVQVGSAYGKIEIDFSGVKRGVTAAVTQLSSFESASKRIGNNLKTIGDQLSVSVTAPLVAVGAAASKTSMEFESAMQQIVGLVGESQQQVNDWSKQLIAMGPEVSRGPKELADALYFVTSSGIESAQAIDVVRNSAKAAAAGLGETKVVADAVTSAMNAYRTSNLSSAEATAVLVATVREGKGEANQIAPALGRVIPVAAQLGVNFKQVGAAMAAMTLVGFDAAESATNLSGILSAFIKPSKQAADTLAKFGLSGEQVRKMLREDGLLATLTLLRDTIGQDDEALAAIFPNVRGFRGLLSLVGENAAQASKIFGELAATTEDDLNRAFEAAASTAKFKFDAAMSELNGSLIEFGNAVLPVVIPVLQDVIRAVRDAAKWFGELDPGLQQAIVQMLALAAATGPVLSIGGRLVSLVGTLVGGLQSIGGAVSNVLYFVQTMRLATSAGEALKFALSSVAVQVGLLVAGLAVMIKFFEAASQAARATNDELIAMANANTGNVIEDMFSRAGAAFELATNGSKRLKEAFIAHQDEMRRKLLAGEVTLQEYNAEVERSAKAAGVWQEIFIVGQGAVTRVDAAVKTLTADQVALLRAQQAVTEGAYGQAGALDETNRAASRQAQTMSGLGDATQKAIDQANEYAAAQRKAADESAAAGAQLDQLRALIDGQVGPTYDDFKAKQDELNEKIGKLRDELGKLETAQGRQIATHKKGTLSANELRLAEIQLAEAQAKLAKETNPEKHAKLAVQIEKLTEKINGASGATQAWVDNSKRIGEIKSELSDLNKALDENAAAYDERMKRILFDMAAEQLAADGLTATEANALTMLAEKWGLIDSATAEATRAVLSATSQLSQDQNLQAFADNMDRAMDQVKDRAAETPSDLSAISTAAQNMAGNVKTQMGNARQAALDMAAGIATSAATTSTTMRNAAADTQTAIGSMRDTLIRYGPNIGDPLKSGMKSVSDEVIAALNAILSKVTDVIEAITGIKLPNVQIPTPTPSGGGGNPGSSPSRPGGGGGGTAPSCFTAGTLIWMADGTQKPIEQIERGERVMAFDPERPGEMGAGVVTETIQRETREYFDLTLANGAHLQVTGEHPFYAPRVTREVERVHGAFLPARRLESGDVIETSQGPAAVLSNTSASTLRPIRVHNLNVEPQHTYVAGGVLVHNVKTRGSGGPMLPNRAYLFNENALTRPEIIVPKVPGYALTRQDAMRALASAAPGSGLMGNQNIYVTVPVGQIGSNIDVEMLALRVADHIRRRR